MDRHAYPPNWTSRSESQRQYPFLASAEVTDRSGLIFKAILVLLTVRPVVAGLQQDHSAAVQDARMHLFQGENPPWM